MILSRHRVLALVVFTSIVSGPAAALARQADGDDATASIVIRHADVHPATPEAARAALGRMGEAAMEVCGASPFSLRDYRASVRASDCWRSAMTTALVKIGDPMLFEAYDRDQHQRWVTFGTR